MTHPKPQILLTNDDGIDSPGLWAAAEELSKVGYVWVIAPREQSSGSGRSMPPTSDGRITIQKKVVNGQEWVVHSVGGTPAQTVQHGILEVIGSTPDLVVSGINYGLNLGLAVTVSGTVGAAMEGAAFGAAALAISLQTSSEHFYAANHSTEIDFSQAAYFAGVFARKLISGDLNQYSRFLKLEVPAEATRATPWMVTRLSLERYFDLFPPERATWDESGLIGYKESEHLTKFKPGTDVHATLIERKVSVTPLTLDMTAPVSVEQLEQALRSG